MSTAKHSTTAKIGRDRYFLLAVIFFLTVVNYADRAIISIAGPAISDEFGLTAIELGFIFSAFGWTYVIGQLPGGWLLDRFGTKWVYAACVGIWSLFTLLQGFVFGAVAVAMLFTLRLLVGLSEAPSFPANSRVVS
ncbi:MAG: MFS transporter, partial [Pseudomonadales bacterium]